MTSIGNTDDRVQLAGLDTPYDGPVRIALQVVCLFLEKI